MLLVAEFCIEALLVTFLIDLFFDREDGNDIFLRKFT
jgi:hypothetical protein